MGRSLHRRAAKGRGTGKKREVWAKRERRECITERESWGKKKERDAKLLDDAAIRWQGCLGTGGDKDVGTNPGGGAQRGKNNQGDPHLTCENFQVHSDAEMKPSVLELTKVRGEGERRKLSASCRPGKGTEGVGGWAKRRRGEDVWEGGRGDELTRFTSSKMRKQAVSKEICPCGRGETTTFRGSYGFLAPQWGKESKGRGKPRG